MGRVGGWQVGSGMGRKGPPLDRWLGWGGDEWTAMRRAGVSLALGLVLQQLKEFSLAVKCKARRHRFRISKMKSGK